MKAKAILLSRLLPVFNTQVYNHDGKSEEQFQKDIVHFLSAVCWPSVHHGMCRYLSNRALFRVYMASSKHKGVGRIRDSYANPRCTVGEGLHNFQEFSQPTEC